MWSDLLPKASYIIALIIIISLEHHYLAARLKRHELARRTIGIATVFAAATPLAIIGVLDPHTLAWLFAGFGAAGAITAGMYTWEYAQDETHRTQLKRALAERHIVLLEGKKSNDEPTRKVEQR